MIFLLGHKFFFTGLFLQLLYILSALLIFRSAQIMLEVTGFFFFRLRRRDASVAAAGRQPRMTIPWHLGSLKSALSQKIANEYSKIKNTTVVLRNYC